MKAIVGIHLKFGSSWIDISFFHLFELNQKILVHSPLVNTSAHSWLIYRFYVFKLKKDFTSRLPTSPITQLMLQTANFYWIPPIMSFNIFPVRIISKINISQLVRLNIVYIFCMFLLIQSLASAEFFFLVIICSGLTGKYRSDYLLYEEGPSPTSSETQ